MSIKFTSKLLILLFGLSLAIVSCSKDDNNNNSSGSNSNSSCSFFPYKAGTIIEEDINGSSYVYTMSDTSINSTNYLYDPNATNIGAGIGYAREGSNGEVIQHIPSQNLNGIVIPEMEATFLYPNKNVGDTWADSSSTSLGGGFSYTSIYNYEIVDKGFSETVLGTSYSNCIKVKLTLATRIIGQTTLQPAFYYYYACGFGFYKTEDNNGALVAKVTKLTL